MDIKSVSEIYNPIFKRKELSFLIGHTSSSSPQLYEVRKSLATKFLVSEDIVYVITLKTRTGTNLTFGKAEIYDSFETAERVVPKHIKSRNAPTRHTRSEEKN